MIVSKQVIRATYIDEGKDVFYIETIYIKYKGSFAIEQSKFYKWCGKKGIRKADTSASMFSDYLTDTYCKVIFSLN